MEEIPFGKRRKIGGGGRAGPTAASRARQMLSAVNSNRYDPATTAEAAAAVPAAESSESVEFTKEEVEALLNEKIKGKGKLEQISESNKKLRLCIKWFQGVEQSLTQEQEKLRNSLEDSEKKCLDSEIGRQRKEDQLTSVNDMYKHLQEHNTSLQQYVSSLQTDLAAANATLQGIDKEKSAIAENLGTLRGRYASLQEQLTSSRALQDEATKQKDGLFSEVNCLRVELQKVRDDRDHLRSRVLLVTKAKDNYREYIQKVAVKLDDVAITVTALQETCASQREQLRMLQHERAAENEKLKMADLSVSETRTEYEGQKQMIFELKERLAEAENQINEKEMLRRKLHNTILELKGNIRVFCRVRPLLPEDGCASDPPVISYPSTNNGPEQGINLVQSGKNHAFTFDRVFSHKASQTDVFGEISELVQSAVDGYKVCIFAYGQTGSGKTYTMMGRPESLEQKGLIPRSLEQIFQTSQGLSSQGWKYKMQASVLEIYNETIRDLLSTNRSEKGVFGKQYSIKHEPNGNTLVSDLTIVDVCSSKEVASLLQQATQNRSVGKTQMNEQSSRSHFVFTLRISAVTETTQKHGVLNLIDLAGTERLSKSGSTGDQLKETQAINKSLSCLTDVIFALSKKDSYIPFRNSTLTYLLEPCLSGDSKTLMFVNLSPEPTSVNESLCSLRFAARVKTCQIGIHRR